LASSGTYDYAISNGEVVLNAFSRIKVYPPELLQHHMQTARAELNLLLAEAANKQVNLWKVDLVSVPLISGQATYDVQPRTVMILDAYITQGTTPNLVDLFITPVSRTEYASFSNKATPGRPTSFWFDRLISPTITLWPVPNQNSTYTLKYYRCTQMQDANLAGGETPDLPYLWLDFFCAGMSHRLARHFATPELEKMRKQDAIEAWNIAAAQNIENSPLVLAPHIGAYFRR